MMALAPRTVQRIPDCFKTLANDGLAARFDDARADEKSLAAEASVTHSLRILLEVLDAGLPRPTKRLLCDRELSY